MRRMIPQKQIEVLDQIEKVDNASFKGVSVESIHLGYNEEEGNVNLAGNGELLITDDISPKASITLSSSSTISMGADQIDFYGGIGGINFSGGINVETRDGREAISAYSDEDGNYIDMSTNEVNIAGNLIVNGKLQASNFKTSTNSQAATVNDGLVTTPIPLLAEAHCAIIKIAQLQTSADNFENIYVKMAINGAGYYIAPISGDDKISFLMAEFTANQLILRVLNINSIAQPITTCTDIQVRWLNQY